MTWVSRPGGFSIHAARAGCIWISKCPSLERLADVDTNDAWNMAVT